MLKAYFGMKKTNQMLSAKESRLWKLNLISLDAENTGKKVVRVVAGGGTCRKNLKIA